jgi:hypothetical protein
MQLDDRSCTRSVIGVKISPGIGAQPSRTRGVSLETSGTHGMPPMAVALVMEIMPGIANCLVFIAR